jgi:hypothetical protein
MSKSPDYVILLGARALTSLAGILHWKLAQRSTMGRVGSQATSSISASSDYRGMEEGDTIGSVEAPPDPFRSLKSTASKQTVGFSYVVSGDHRLDILGGHVFPRDDWYGGNRSLCHSRVSSWCS